MTKEERMKEIAKASPDFGKMTGYKMCVVDELYDIKELKKENAELREKVKWYSEQVCFKECAEVWGKSKELLKKLSSSYEYAIQHKGYADREVLTEVKQFLKE